MTATRPCCPLCIFSNKGGMNFFTWRRSSCVLVEVVRGILEAASIDFRALAEEKDGDDGVIDIV